MAKQTDSETQQTLDIRKYPNRRYYDCTRSRHVTLEELQNLIRDGHEVRVTDSRSGEDISGKVLTQIILELDSPKLQIFPVPLLHRLIRANEELIRDFIEKYFNQALDAFLGSQRQFEQYLRQTMRLQPPSQILTDWTRLMLGPFSAPEWGEGTVEGAGADPAAAGAQPVAGHNGGTNVHTAIEELRREVAALREEVARNQKPEK